MGVDSTVGMARAPDPEGGIDRPVVAVVGGGMAGLSAGWFLSEAVAAPRVIVLEATEVVGGKVATGQLAWGEDIEGQASLLVDTGAESMLARRTEGTDLARQTGLADELVTPRPVAAWVWSRGEKYRLPQATLLGVPSVPESVAALLGAKSVAGVAAEANRTWDPITEDVSVADFIATRLGHPVLDRLVEPLLGGVYAGRADELSLQATMPGLWQAAIEGTSIVRTAAATTAAAVTVGADGGASDASAGPVFAGVNGGLGRFPIQLAHRLRSRGVEVAESSTVSKLMAVSGGGNRSRWRLVLGPTTDEHVVDVDAVVLATPAPATARLLRDVAPNASAALACIDYASVALVTFVMDRSAVHGVTGSGFLVPPVDGRLVKAATFSSAKWGWLDEKYPGQVVVRASVGRYRSASDLHLDDIELTRRVLTELRLFPGIRLPDPLCSAVTRWGGALPQYAVGHIGLVERVRQQVATCPGLAVAGAAYDGVGIPACIASGRLAADQVLTHLWQWGSARGTLSP